jgi:formate dehydrogenase (NADP+) beta subunit
MNKVIFSSWAGKIIDNRANSPADYVDAADLKLPLEMDGRKLKAFISWDGLVVADAAVDVVDMAYAYLKEAQKLACGECSLGNLGMQAMLDIFSGIAKGKGTAADVDRLRALAAGIKQNARCNFCASAVNPILDIVKYFAPQLTRPEKRRAKSYALRVTAPCMEACPAHQDAPGYIELIKNRRYDASLGVIRQTNCLPQTLGRACVAFCEANCTRCDIDKPVAIRALKRFAAARGKIAAAEKKTAGQPKVAVIGAGPAGLACAYNLAGLGYPVTIFDDLPAAGGMALAGIPAFRLPKDVLADEVKTVTAPGVEIKSKTTLGKDIALDKLPGQGYKAVFVATGAHHGREFDAAGWQQGFPGLVDGARFLRDVNLGKKIEARSRAVIVGGGNVAVDCARTCLRLGFKDVTIVYRRSRTEMPGRKDEIAAAEQEGVKIVFLAVPVKVITEGNRVTGAQCVRMELGQPDASGRRRPVPVKGSEFTIPADFIIPAIGESPDLSFLTKGQKVEATEQGTIKVAPFTCQTGEMSVFSGGDCVTGPATLIEAMAAGNRAARSIDRYLSHGTVAATEEDFQEKLTHQVGLSRGWEGTIPARQRQSPEELPTPARLKGFDEVEKVFTAESAAKEAERCLRCYRVMLMAVATSRSQSRVK